MSDFASMKIADLKKELKAKGLPVSGNKQELIERLTSTSDGVEDTSLLDDDLDQDDEVSEEAIKAAEEELKKQQEEGDGDSSPAKKLKTSDNKENDSDDKNDAVSESDKIKARAERFGGFQSDSAKKAARAERFGMSGGAGNTKIGDAPPVDIDILKKRAERFGATVSPHVQNAEVSEAIKKRQERFGIVDKSEKGPQVKTNVGTNSVVLTEQMLKRKQRFGAM